MNQQLHDDLRGFHLRFVRDYSADRQRLRKAISAESAQSQATSVPPEAPLFPVRSLIMRPMKSPIMRPVVTMAAFIASGAILWITLFSEQPVAYADSVKAAKEAMAGVRNLHATSTLTSKDGQHVTQAWLQTDPPRSRQEAFGYITIDDSVRQVTFHHEARVASKVEPSEVAQSLSLFQQDELLARISHR